jgi:DNA-binding response OmpR family regulator
MPERDRVTGEANRGARVLVVERDPKLLELITLTLRARGYTVLDCHSAASALAQLQNSTPALIIVGDLEPDPNRSGEDPQLALVRRLRRVPRLHDTKLLLLGSNPTATELADAQLPKPFTGGQLRSAVEALLHAPVPSSPVPQHTVMVIEDSAALRGLIGDILHRQGYRVESAETVPQARALIASHAHRVSLILLDINLPGGSGFDLLKLIRERTDAPVFILSALRQEEQVLLGQALGAQAFIEKPFNPRELVEKIRATLT